MESLKYIKEYLQTSDGTEGQLLIPRKIYDVLIDEVDKNLIPRSEAALYFGPGDIPGSSIDVDLVTPNKMDVRIIGEGAELPMDNTEYSSINLKPVKYGVAVRITKEMMEDSKFKILEHNIRLAGQRFAENENSLIISDALDNAGATTTGGAAITIANIAESMYDVENNDYKPSTYLVGNEVLQDLRNIDTFVEADKLGSREMLEMGFVGKIFGMYVIRASSNAGMTATSSYVYDKNHAFVIAEKRTVTVERFDIPTSDMSAAAITQRIKIRQLRANAISKITTS